MTSIGKEKRKLKILFISQYFYPEQFSNNAIAKELVGRGHSVAVVTCVPNYPQGKFFAGYSNKVKRTEYWEGVEISRAWTIARGSSRIRLLANFLTYPISALLRIKQIGRGDSDVSFVSMPSPLFQALAGIWAKRIWRIPTVYWVQDLWPETIQYLLNIKNKSLLKLLNAICGWIYRAADIVMVQSPAMIPLVERHGVPSKKIRVLSNTAAILHRPYCPRDFPDVRVLLPKGKFCVLFAGNVGESQGLEVLADAAHKLRDREEIAFVIVGNGRALPHFQNRVNELGLGDKFTFCGRRPEQEIPAFLSHADCLFFSLRDFPNFALTLPYKVQTYLASARPIVASVAGEGARVVREARAGLTCPPEDGEALARIIGEMADLSPERRASMGENGRRYFERFFSPEVVYGTLEDALMEAASGRGVGGA